MSAIPAVTWLQAPAPGPDMGFFLMLGTIGLIFYFLVFRPQSKQRKELEEAIKGAVKGDEVVTAGGLHGKVQGAGEATLTLEIGSVKGAPVRVEVDRSRIERVVKASEARESRKGAKDKES